MTDDITRQVEMLTDAMIGQEIALVEEWMREQGADPNVHLLLKFFDYDSSLTYVLSVRKDAEPIIERGLMTVEAAKARWPYLYVKPDLPRCTCGHKYPHDIICPLSGARSFLRAGGVE